MWWNITAHAPGHVIRALDPFSFSFCPRCLCMLNLVYPYVRLRNLWFDFVGGMRRAECPSGRLCRAAVFIKCMLFMDTRRKVSRASWSSCSVN